MDSKKQKQIFLDSEGDRYFERNKKFYSDYNPQRDFLLKEILSLKALYSETISVLEIGCGEGKRLEVLKKNGFIVSGVDPSKAAIDVLHKNGIEGKVGTADELPFAEGEFDVVVFGFCLYLCDRDDLFKIASEANRVLKNDGFVVILDFYSKEVTENNYHHREGIKSYKMDYSKLFDWHPHYSLIKKTIGAHGDFIWTDDKNEWISIAVLRKQN